MVRLLEVLFAVVKPRPRRGAACFAFLILGAYVLGMWHWNREIAREAATRDLRDKIVGWVSQQPARPGGYELNDLQRAQIVLAEDLEFLESQGYVYQAIGPDSPPGSVLFLKQKGENHEWYCYKDGSTSYMKRWPAPGSKAVLCDLPHPHRSGSRLLRIERVGAQHPLGEYVTESHYRTVHWNESGNLVAIDAPLEGADVPLTLWHVGANTAEVIPLPPQLSLDWLLSRETPHADTSWGMDSIEAKRWTDTRELFVHAQGHGSYVHPATKKKMGFNLIYSVLLEIDPHNACQIKSVKRRHFAQSEFR